MALAATRSRQIALIVRIALAAAVFGYGVYIAEPGAPRLMAFGLTLFALPLLFQFLPWPLVRAYALWFGAFLVMQSLMTPLLLGDAAYLIGLTPNATRHTTYADGALYGIAGLQRTTRDERGFRVNPRVDYAHKSGVRIFAIGGSTTQDIHIDDEATWTHRLQVALAKELGKPIEVINTGVAGLRTRHHIATLKHILPLQPDIVLFLVGTNDWNFDTYSLFGSNRVVRHQMFPETLLGRVASAQYSRLFFRSPPKPIVLTVQTDPYLDVRGSLERAQKISWFPETASEQYRANLLRISETCWANKINCVFLTQPNAYTESATQDFRKLFWMTPPSASYTLTFESLVHLAKLYNLTLVEFAKRQGHPFCDLAPQIDPTIDYFIDEIHFTPSGAARVAELVTECVKPLVTGVP